MPPQLRIFGSALREIILLKQRHAQASGKNQEALHNQLTLHLLELPDILSQDEFMTPDSRIKLLECLRTWPHNAFGASKMLSGMIAHEKLKKGIASGQPLTSRTKLPHGARRINSVIVSGSQLRNPVACVSTGLDIHYDVPAEKYRIHRDTLPILIYEGQDPALSGQSKAYTCPDAEGGPALSFSPRSIIDATFDGPNVKLKVAHYGTHFHRGCVRPIAYTKTIRLDFPSSGQTRAFLEELQQHCHNETLPLWNALPAYPYTAADKPQRLAALYDLESIFVGGDTLTASSVNDSLLLNIVGEVGEPRKGVVLGSNGVSWLEWGAMYSFLVGEVVDRRWWARGGWFVLEDGTAVDVAMKSVEDAARLRGVVEGLGG